MMRMRVIAILTRCLLSLLRTNANRATRRTNRGVEHRHRKDGDGHASPICSHFHNFSEPSMLLVVLIAPAISGYFWYRGPVSTNMLEKDG